MRREAARLLVVIAAAVGVSCARDLPQAPGGNQPPEVQLRLARMSAAGDSCDLRLSWSATDPDDAIDYYLIAIDPASLERVDGSWMRTNATDHVLRVPAQDLAREHRRFAVRAVDHRGATSAPAVRPLTASSLPPLVVITSPAPSSFFAYPAGTCLRIHWDGNDPDGVFTDKPVKYKFKLLSENSPEFDIGVACSNPSAIHLQYGPTYAGWDSVSAETTTVLYTNVTPNLSYLFMLTAVDEAGDYDTTFSCNQNLLNFRATFPNTTLPVIRMFNESFDYAYPVGMYDPSRYARIEAPARGPVTINWNATPFPGTTINSYRWVLDPVDLADETPRSDEQADWWHWSHRSLNITSATVGPFAARGLKREVHRLYIEAICPASCELEPARKSLGVVEFVVEPAAPTGELLIVDDTRLVPDRFQNGCAVPPTGPWPTAAELDTFLFARGDFPWKCYAPGTMSAPGLFNGYAFDTLGTRGLRDGIVPLTLLSSYRHVIWYTNIAAASSPFSWNHPTNPMAALRSMTDQNRFNTLAAYVKQGGKLWLAGGGSGYASLIEWNRIQNDGGGVTVFSNAQLELGPGRMMYDLAHGRSEFSTRSAPITVVKSTRAVGGWPGAPDYNLLPAALQLNNGSMGSDPVPPGRTTGFYQSVSDIEYLSQPNTILEGDFPEVSTLDTLMDAMGTGLPASPAHNACMTLYHGSDNASLVFSGFNFWSFRRAQCQQLVDFVLQEVWGLSKSAPAVARTSAAVSRPDRRPGAGTRGGAGPAPAGAARRATPAPIRR